MDEPICRKCGESFSSMEEGFYWNRNRVCWKRPCKKCLADYNKRPDQREVRKQANRRYKKTDKGRRAEKRAKQRYKNRR